MDNPCSNCITKPICRLRIEEIYNKVHISSGYSKNIALYSAYVNKLKNMCPMVDEYINKTAKRSHVKTANHRHQFVAVFVDQTFFKGKYEINAFILHKPM